MDAQTIGTLAIAAMLGMMALRIPIAVAMLVAGMGGYVAIAGVVPLLAYLKTGPFAVISNYSLSVVPLFLLMGNLATRSGLSRALFAAANASLGSFRGGLAMAAIGGCAMFGAICGSSLATAATMGRVALPEMKRYGYSDALATGTLAAGGTLGILIPPSVVLVIYAIITEQNVAKMFLAAFVPGILAAIGYMLAIAVYLGCFLHMGIVYGGIIKFGLKLPFINFFRGILDAMMVAYSTSSSSATLPRMAAWPSGSGCC